MWDFFDVPGTRARRCWPTRTMPGARWFPGRRAELRRAGAAVGRRPAGGEFRSEPGGRPPETISHRELRRRVAEVAAGLRGLGVGRGDRVAAYAPNIPETLIAFLATASLGAIWSSCSPDFGVTAVLDRFRQIEPKVLLAADGYVYRGTVYDRRAGGGRAPAEPAERGGGGHRRQRRPAASTASRSTTWPRPAPAPNSRSSGCRSSTRCGCSTRRAPPACPRPSSTATAASSSSTSRRCRCTTTWAATTGSSGSRSTGWMMWNLLVGGLLVGATRRPLRRQPGRPRPRRPVADGGGHRHHLLRGQRGLPPVVHEGRDRPPARRPTCPGCGARLDRRAAHAGGVPVGRTTTCSADLVLGSVSGGTDVCTAFVGSCPTAAGAWRARSSAATWARRSRPSTRTARAVVDEVGELVVTEPMPSMPVFLWGDEDHARYRSSLLRHVPRACGATATGSGSRRGAAA